MRAAAITYGVDCQGVASTMLHKMRSTIAAAASAEAAGKNVDRVLHFCDGLNGSLHPAVDAFSLGLKRWATACWEEWLPRGTMTRAFEEATAKCCRTRVLEHSVWPSRGARGLARNHRLKLGWSGQVHRRHWQRVVRLP